ERASSAIAICDRSSWFESLSCHLQVDHRLSRRPNNVILFVPDGLRPGSVTPESAPTMAALRGRGVNFENSHSLFPTLTTTNASAFATGHYLGDTGGYGDTIYTGFPVAAANGSVLA